ncbi:YlaH-like family protein [Domibacillus robiginosus]|uniref:YlaH-like family protein n=1 Tax=Domibacillus robiginosus TaxID=1071054 RepID=UPI00067BC179|nr:YlaH-like family protein [Domibacillus robiginosus]
MEGLQHVGPLLRALIESFGVQTAVYIYWGILIALSILVYNLGFAKKLKMWQNAIVYVSLTIGSLLLLILSYQLPVVESLLVAALVLGTYKLRLRKHQKQERTARL